MKQEILNHIEDPAYLEKLYRTNKSLFKASFSDISIDHNKSPVVECWHVRLNYESNYISWGSKKDLLFVSISCLIAGLIAKIPALFAIPEDLFYQRNIGFIVLPLLIVFFAWKNNMSAKMAGIICGTTLISLIYINLLPENQGSDTLILACIHLPLLLWILLGAAFSANAQSNVKSRLNFLRFNGDVAVMIAVLAIAAAILSGITFGLFNLIGINIEQFFQDYLIVFGLPAIPILATFLTNTNPQLVNKVSPIIAKLFSPVVLIMLIVYLGAIIYSGKDPYNDRDFLLLFNSLLIGVMALIFFSVAEGTGKSKLNIDFWILLLLSIVTIIVNGIALSAILFRIAEWGLTPNRMAVLGSNILMLIHLLLIASKLFKTFTRKTVNIDIGKSIALYLPVYFVWIAIVVFLFPIIFGFK